MGTKDRKLREKEELKGLILKAAKDVFMEKGYENTSIRNIADKIEYSPGTIYLYFKDKDTILHQLHTEGFQLLAQQMKVLENVSDPFERLMAMGKVYIAFAQTYPEYYELMFILKAPMNAIEEEECWKEGEGAFSILIHVIDECKKAGRFLAHDTEDLAFLIWSAVHGMASLSIKERCRIISEDRRDNIESLGLANLFQLLKNS